MGARVVIRTGQGRSQFLPVLGVAAFGAGMLLLFPPGQYGFYPRCPVREVTGLLCPGCGGTRALAALLRGHLIEALGWNPLIAMAALLLGPAFLLCGVARRVWPQRISRATLHRWQHPLGVAALVVSVVFTAWRNLP